MLPKVILPYSRVLLITHCPQSLCIRLEYVSRSLRIQNQPISQMDLSTGVGQRRISDVNVESNSKDLSLASNKARHKDLQRLAYKCGFL